MGLFAPNFTDFEQADRLIRVKTTLGENTLIAQSCKIKEGISRLFKMRVAVHSKRGDIKPAEILGTTADVLIASELGTADQRRPWNGLVTELYEGPIVARGFRHYELMLRPQLWLMSQKSDCRIWQNQSALDVLNTLMGEYGFPSAKIQVQGAPSPQAYSVQWNETDLAYLTRRLEEDGLFYWFTHQQGSHTLNIGNAPNCYRDGAMPQVKFNRGMADDTNITGWTRRYLYTPGKHAGADWNFRTPNTVPLGQTKSLVQLPKNDAYELYHYPIHAATNADAERMTKLRIQAIEADHEKVTGASGIGTLAPAERFEPTDEANPSNTFEKQIILTIEHLAINGSRTPSGPGDEYTNEFIAIPARLPATPLHKTPRPRIDGTQIAIVAGPTGEEIHTDEFGQVKLWFPWDRRAKKDGTDTCWVRVMQNWAGGKWGGQVIPRVGMEAMVSYVDGDPDRPMVIGLVPNPEKSVPYGLPGHKTKMVIRSQTYKAKGANEFTLEDQTDQQNVFMHAQRDMTSRVLNNQTHRVDANAVTSIGANQAIEVGGNVKHEIGGSINLTIGGTGPDARAALAGVEQLASSTAALLQQAGSLAGVDGGFGGTTDNIASSSLGFLSGDGLTSRAAVVKGPDPTQDAGHALRQAGSGVGGDVGQILSSQPGTMNTVVARAHTRSVGETDAEQVGIAKVTNVGSTWMTGVGQYYVIEVGTQFIIRCGKSELVMNQDGTITLSGTDIVQIKGNPVGINCAQLGSKPSA